MGIYTVADMRAAAAAIHGMGAAHVVVKGGHLPQSSDAVDVLYDGSDYTELRIPRVPTRNTHGTGCTFASAIAAELAKGKGAQDAVGKAKAYVTAALRTAASLAIGRGHGPLDHLLGQSVRV